MMTGSSETLSNEQLSRAGSTSSDTTGSGYNSHKGAHKSHNNHCQNHKHRSMSNLTSPTKSKGKVIAMTERWFLCSQTARTEARLLAILDLISSIVYLTIFGMLTVAVIMRSDELPESQDITRLLTYGRAKQAFFLSTLLSTRIASFIIAILIFIGAQKRSYGIVRACFMASIIYITIDIILFIPKTIYTQNVKTYVIMYLFNVIYVVYELWVIYELKKEVLEWKEKQEDLEHDSVDTTVVGEVSGGCDA